PPCSRTADLARSAEFASRPIAPWTGAQSVEKFARLAQSDTRVHGTALAPQPFAIGEQTRSASEWPTCHVNAEGLLKQALGLSGGSEERFAVGDDYSDPRHTGNSRALLELGKRGGNNGLLAA